MDNEYVNNKGDREKKWGKSERREVVIDVEMTSSSQEKMIMKSCASKLVDKAFL